MSPSCPGSALRRSSPAVDAPFHTEPPPPCHRSSPADSSQSQACALLSVGNSKPLPEWWDAAGNKAYHQDRKSTRLNSSHVSISYAVFCLKKKKIKKLYNNISFNINIIFF